MEWATGIDGPMFWLTLSGSILATIGTGAPLGAALGLTGLVILQLFANGATSLAMDAVWNVLTEFTLSAIPLFIFMGEVLLRSGVSQRVYRALAPAFSRVPGGLLHTNIAVCTVFGAVSGSSLSTAAAVGSVAYPEMQRLGYQRPMIVGSLAAGGTLGLLIPPSLALLIYGALTETSVGKLFLAGILPGLMMAALFMVYIWLRCRSRPDLSPGGADALPLLPTLLSLLRIWPLALLFVAVMGSILGGIATPTEAAGVGLAAAIVIGFVWGDLTPAKLWQAFVGSVATFGSIGFVVVGAVILGQSVSILGVPQELVRTVGSLNLAPWQVLALVVLIYLVLGCLFDGLSIMIMTLPIVVPLMTALGYDPVWLGVIITIMIEIGMVTPPVGLNLYVLTAITGRQVTPMQAASATVPYWLLLLLGVAILTLAPQIALFLPGLI